MERTISLLDQALPWVPVLVMSLVLGYVGKFFTTKVWTEARAERSTWFRIMYKTLPLHPIGAGALLGLIPAVPVAPVFEPNLWGRGLQGALAGVLSIVVYDAFRRWVKKRGIVARDQDRVPDTMRGQ